MPEHHRRATETVETLSVIVVTTNFSVVLANREEAYGCILAALLATEASTLQRVLSIFDEMAAAGVTSISLTGARDIIRSLPARTDLKSQSPVEPARR